MWSGFRFNESLKRLNYSEGTAQRIFPYPEQRERLVNEESFCVCCVLGAGLLENFMIHLPKRIPRLPHLLLGIVSSNDHPVVWPVF